MILHIVSSCKNANNDNYTDFWIPRILSKLLKYCIICRNSYHVWSKVSWAEIMIVFNRIPTIHNWNKYICISSLIFDTKSNFMLPIIHFFIGCSWNKPVVIILTSILNRIWKWTHSYQFISLVEWFYPKCWCSIGSQSSYCEE